MKIEHVSFDNINSLCGHFEVDFTHPTLTDPGIFVITGPTGVGKTSLLDAVSFALYGKTARQKGVTENQDELMTRGAPFCRAKLLFEKDGRRYIVSTEHYRKRSGVGFRQQRRKLERMSEDGTVSLLANQVNAVDAMVENITGLRFENFTRCMMLAQGKFAQFLEAGAAKRSEVLSTITGTEIYQSVGEIVAAHKTELEKEREKISLQEVLAPEVRAQKEEGLAAAEKSKAKVLADVKAIEDALRWLEAMARAQNNLTVKDDALRRARAELEAFAEDGSAAKLQAAEAALVVQPFHVQAVQTSKSVREEEEALAKENDWLEKNKGMLQQAENAEKEAVAQLEKERPGIEKSLQWLGEVVRPLEQQVRLAEAANREAQRQAKAASTEAQTATREAVNAASALSQACILETNAASAYNHLEADATLGDDLPVIRQRLRDWAAAPAAADDLPALAHLQELLQKTRQQLHALLGGRREEELPLLAERMNQLASLDRETKQAQADLARAETSELQAQQVVAGLESVPDAEKCYQACREATRLAAQVAGLEDRLNALYLDFQAGKYPCCPCCGSPTPHERHVTPGALQERQRAEEAALALLEKRRKAAEAAARALVSAKMGAANARKTLSSALGKQREALSRLGWEEMPDDLPARQQACAADVAHLAKLKRQAEILAEQVELATLREKFHECLRPWSRELPLGTAAARQLVAGLEKRLKAYRQAERAAKQAAEAKEKAQLVHTHAQEAATHAEEKAARAASKAQNAAAELQKQRDTLSQNHKGEASEIEEKRLRETLKQQETAYAAAHRKAEEQRNSHQHHQTLRNRALTHLPELATARHKATTAFGQALAQAGFADETAYTNALSFVAQKDALQQRYGRLTNTLSSCQGAANEAQKAWETLQQQQLTTESAETLTDQLQKLQTLCHQTEELVTNLRSMLLKDDDAHRANREKAAQDAELYRQLKNWEELFSLLGGTKDGFKKYAQQITFDILVQHANRQLCTLSERYTLLSDPTQELALRVLDNCRDEAEGRSCSNLSGGESFIISLALALGLSRMAGSKTSIDTLFLDEGFGTLDDASLERVLAGLQNLRAGGKLVGIISHVAKLQARIPAEIALEPRGSTGLSTFRPHAAVVAEPAFPAEAHEPSKAQIQKEEQEGTRRQAILQALSNGPLIEKEIGAAIGDTRGNRNILKDMVAAGLILYAKPYYRLVSSESPND